MHYVVTLNEKGRVVRRESWPNDFVPPSRGREKGFYSGGSTESMEDARQRATEEWRKR
jgi:hypothetical protein